MNDKCINACSERIQTRSCVVFPNLDHVKLFMALLVVEIHAKPLSVFGNELINRIVAGIDCVAVPFFFIASGFLCFRGMTPEQFRNRGSASCSRVRSTVKNLLFLYAVWFFLMAPFDIFGYLQAGCSLPKGLALEIRGLLLVGEGSYSWPLWYLLASVVGFSLVYAMLRGGGSSSCDIGGRRGYPRYGVLDLPCSQLEWHFERLVGNS